MSQFERHIFVCLSGRACPHQGALEVFQSLRARAKAAGITDRVRINKSGCLAQCGFGPMAVVYPEGVWYSQLRPEDATEIVEEHLIAGRPVERCRYHPPGPGIQLCPPGSEPIPPANPPDEIALS